jgi:hypothetical protein
MSKPNRELIRIYLTMLLNEAQKPKRKKAKSLGIDEVIFTRDGKVVDMMAEEVAPSDPEAAQKMRDERAKYHARCRRAFKMPPKSGGGVQ